MGIFDTIQEESTFSKGSGISYQYVVLQVTLKEKFIGTGSGNLTELEKVINEQAAKGDTACILSPPQAAAAKA